MSRSPSPSWKSTKIRQRRAASPVWTWIETVTLGTFARWRFEDSSDGVSIAAAAYMDVDEVQAVLASSLGPLGVVVVDGGGAGGIETDHLL